MRHIPQFPRRILSENIIYLCQKTILFSRKRGGVKLFIKDNTICTIRTILMIYRFYNGTMLPCENTIRKKRFICYRKECPLCIIKQFL